MNTTLRAYHKTQRQLLSLIESGEISTENSTDIIDSLDQQTERLNDIVESISEETKGEGDRDELWLELGQDKKLEKRYD